MLLGNILQQLVLPKDIFAEGCVVIDDLIYMLTWKEHKLLVITADALQVNTTLIPVFTLW